MYNQSNLGTNLTKTELTKKILRQIAKIRREAVVTPKWTEWTASYYRTGERQEQQEPGQP